MSPCFFGSRFLANSKAPSDTIITIERAIVSTFTHAAQLLKALDAPEPIFTTLTMMGAKGRQMALPRYGPDSGYLSPAFDRDTIIGPDVSIQNWEESSPYPSTLLPLVNSLWQAAGLQQTPTFVRTVCGAINFVLRPTRSIPVPLFVPSECEGISVSRYRRTLYDPGVKRLEPGCTFLTEGRKPTVLMLIDRNELESQLLKNVEAYGFKTVRLPAST